MRKEFDYPDTLYCDQCETDVEIKKSTCTRMIEDTAGKRYPVTFTAALCPVCGKIVCDRDYYYSLNDVLERIEGR